MPVGYKHNELDKLNMSATWDKKLELTPESSRYYAECVKAYGKKMADYYWNRRHSYEMERDYEFRGLCKEINEKCNKFLKSRGVDTKLDKMWWIKE